MLWQFQCYREGTLFYYQHDAKRLPSHIVERCPVCGTREIEVVRAFPDLDETSEEAEQSLTGKPARARK